MANYRSYRRQAQNQINDRLNELLHTLAVAGDSYITPLVPVDTGNLKNSQDFAVDDKSQKITWGNYAEYAPAVELGTSRQRSQSYIKTGIMSNLDSLRNITRRLGG